MVLCDDCSETPKIQTANCIVCGKPIESLDVEK